MGAARSYSGRDSDAEKLGAVIGLLSPGDMLPAGKPQVRRRLMRRFIMAPGDASTVAAGNVVSSLATGRRPRIAERLTHACGLTRIHRIDWKVPRPARWSRARRVLVVRPLSSVRLRRDSGHPAPM